MAKESTVPIALRIGTVSSLGLIGKTLIRKVRKVGHSGSLGGVPHGSPRNSKGVQERRAGLIC